MLCAGFWILSGNLSKVAKEQQETRKSEAGFFCPAYVGLRCVLLIMVLEGHYWFEATSNRSLNILTFAVPVFFALSGYLISHTLFSYEEYDWKDAARVFYARRALRILPPFYLVLLVAHLIHAVPYLGWHLAYAINIKIFLLSAFEHGRFLGYLGYGDFKAMHYWSVNVEEQFYILYPLFIAWTAGRRRTSWLVFGILSSIAIRAYLYHSVYRSFYGGLPFVAGEVVLWGCLLAWLDHQGKIRWLCNRLAMYGSLLIFLVVGLNDPSYAPWAQWKPPYHQTVYCILIAVFVMSLRYSNDTWLAKLLSWKPMAVIGEMSYGAYLVHIFLNPAAEWMALRFPFLAPFEACPIAITGPILTLSVAALMWYGFEKPINRFRRRFRLGEKKS